MTGPVVLFDPVIRRHTAVNCKYRTRKEAPREGSYQHATSSHVCVSNQRFATASKLIIAKRAVQYMVNSMCPAGISPILQSNNYSYKGISTFSRMEALHQKGEICTRQPPVVAEPSKDSLSHSQMSP